MHSLNKFMKITEKQIEEHSEKTISSHKSQRKAEESFKDIKGK